MFDNLRDDASNSFYEEDDSELFPEDDVMEMSTVDYSVPTSGKKFLGMTAIQRFVIVVMLFFAVFALGAMCLLLTGKIGLL